MSDARMCPECGAAAQTEARCARCGAAFATVERTVPPRPSGPAVEAAWVRAERATWAYLATVGAARGGLLWREGGARGWMLAGAAAMALAVLWAMRNRHGRAMGLWARAVAAGAGVAVPAALWSFAGHSALGRGVSVVSTAAVCAYAAVLWRARRAIEGP